MAKKTIDPARRDVEATVYGPQADAIGDSEAAAAPRACRGRAQRRNVLPLIADALIDRALEGSVSHVKSLIELGVYDRGALRPKRRTRIRSTAELLLERWELEKQERREQEKTNH
jgi:hypothetical protein